MANATMASTITLVNARQDSQDRIVRTVSSKNQQEFFCFVIVQYSLSTVLETLWKAFRHPFSKSKQGSRLLLLNFRMNSCISIARFTCISLRSCICALILMRWRSNRCVESTMQPHYLRTVRVCFHCYLCATLSYLKTRVAQKKQTGAVYPLKVVWGWLSRFESDWWTSYRACLGPEEEAFFHFHLHLKGWNWPTHLLKFRIWGLCSSTWIDPYILLLVLFWFLRHRWVFQRAMSARWHLSRRSWWIRLLVYTWVYRYDVSNRWEPAVIVMSEREHLMQGYAGTLQRRRMTSIGWPVGIWRKLDMMYLLYLYILLHLSAIPAFLAGLWRGVSVLSAQMNY